MGFWLAFATFKGQDEFQIQGLVGDIDRQVHSSRTSSEIIGQFGCSWKMECFPWGAAEIAKC